MIQDNRFSLHTATKMLSSTYSYSQQLPPTPTALIAVEFVNVVVLHVTLGMVEIQPVAKTMDILHAPIVDVGMPINIVVVMLVIQHVVKTIKYV